MFVVSFLAKVEILLSWEPLVRWKFCAVVNLLSKLKKTCMYRIRIRFVSNNRHELAEPAGEI